MNRANKKLDSGNLAFVLKQIVDMIVDNPCTVGVVEKTSALMFEIAVDELEYGKVIGKGGQNAKALITVINAISGSYDRRLLVAIKMR